MCNLSQSVLERGRQEGKACGKIENAIDVALKMLTKGKLAVEEIAEYSGLSIAKVLELKNENRA